MRENYSVTYSLPLALTDAVKRLANHRSRTASAEVKEALENHVATNGKKPSRRGVQLRGKGEVR